MKKLITLLLIITTSITYSQASSHPLNAVNVPVVNNDPPRLIGCDPIPNGIWRVYIKDSIKWEPENINNLNDAIENVGDIRYKPISYTPTNSEIITALGFTPYDGITNSSGFLTVEVDGSTTNEIELPNQTGNSDKFLTTNGTTTSWVSHINDTVTLFGDVTGSGTTTIVTTLANSGVTAGSYGYVTVDTKGRVLSGKRLELYSGTTNASGNYTVTFSTPYSVAPNIQASITNQSSTNQTIRVTSVSTTGFTVNVYQRNSVNLLGVDVLLSATVNVSGATVDILVTEK